MIYLNDIADSINNYKHDLRAEAIVADLMEHGVMAGDVVVCADGTFRRRFKNDISEAEVEKLNNSQNILKIHITRDGLYDMLPEGLFHSQKGETVDSGQAMASRSKKQKLEEKQARKFFLPFENELFLQNVAVELTERRLLSDFSKNLFNDIYPRFWNLDESIPHKPASRLVLLLHYANKVSGNLELIAKCLEIIIDEQVSVQKKYIPITEECISETDTSLGQTTLGNRFICGQSLTSSSPCLQFRIGPLQHSQIEDYLDGAGLRKCLKTYFDYFIPFEFEVETMIEVDKNQEFVLNEHSNAPVLGFNTVLKTI